ncbi:hypothetical protein K432DRAFT_408101 [Lepidopterella palustris CBS 459.81]|uniref:MYND-type domain-containing protein n=1 Tax=Lepidopterella palustris CBS 459.81 TaxID=1314670 RepID=A0A8E2E3A4_9PEZI|nr:hypothetical protein K432DRAFT_408101 [Lepidopterella palustris CBS 459.81]
MASPSLSTSHYGVRLNFKDSLFTMLMNFSGLQGRHLRIFVIEQPDNGGAHAIFFVKDLLLDPSNATVIIDGAVLVLSDKLYEQTRPFMASLSSQTFRNFKINEDELKLWKYMIPAYIGRCRQWENLPGCEYKVPNKVPLAYEHGKQVLCSCGNGKLPPDFITGIPKWEMVAKYSVRVAISPSFSAPFVEKIYDSSAMFTCPVCELEQVCGACGKKKGKNGQHLMVCARCRNAKYCSKACQTEDWKEQKQSCVSNS